MNELIGDHLDECAEGGVIPRDAIEACGERYREQGYLTRRQLYALSYAVSTRNAHRVMRNSREECETMTANAVTVTDDISRITLLTGLCGLETLTASCVLAGLDPQRYAVGDETVWAALADLGRVRGSNGRIGPREYCVLLEHVRAVAAESDYSPATVGYALYAYGSE
ncbi:hypothetical protein [Natronorubrum halophilum]|uniref:hypothetical protein n=1 Tax=Natronorubrum halophilum TaxID=1702106 RepID=UPI0010C1BCA1|nr:hypothetical protein [Natronorubrum halophilum]